MTGPLLLEQDIYFFGEVYSEEKEFKASSGFQWRFTKRFGIKILAIFGEKIIQLKHFVMNLKI